MKQFRDGSFDLYLRQIESLLGIMGVKWPGEVMRSEERRGAKHVVIKLYSAHSAE